MSDAVFRFYPETKHILVDLLSIIRFNPQTTHTLVELLSIISFNPETKPTSVELLSIISFNWFHVGPTTSSIAIRKKISMCKLDWGKLRLPKRRVDLFAQLPEIPDCFPSITRHLHTRASPARHTPNECFLPIQSRQPPHRGMLRIKSSHPVTYIPRPFVPSQIGTRRVTPQQSLLLQAFRMTLCQQQNIR